MIFHYKLLVLFKLFKNAVPNSNFKQCTMIRDFMMRQPIIRFEIVSKIFYLLAKKTNDSGYIQSLFEKFTQTKKTQRNILFE